MNTCHDCGHEHPTMASVSKPSTVDRGWVERFFCHEDDHSCYNNNRGHYFD